jgi:hypothetical protein
VITPLSDRDRDPEHVRCIQLEDRWFQAAADFADCIKNNGVAGWFPIASAPTEGTPILVWAPPDRYAVVKFVGAWKKGYWGLTEGGGEWEPTHWRPLPLAPDSGVS